MRSLDSFRKSEGWLLDFIIVILVVLFCFVFTIFLATWHKDTHHNLVKQDYQLGDVCEECDHHGASQSDQIEDKFCSSDIVVIAKVATVARNYTSTLRVYTMRVKQVVKMSKPLKSKKVQSHSIKLFVFNATTYCNYWFSEDTEYLLSGTVILPPKVSHTTLVVSPCNLAFKWSTLPLERKFLFREILDDSICKV